MTFIIGCDMECATERKITLTLLKDSERIFNVIVRSDITAEKRLVIDIQAVREAFENKEIDHVGWIRTKENIADRLTRTKKFEVLEKHLDTTMIVAKAE